MRSVFGVPLLCRNLTNAVGVQLLLSSWFKSHFREGTAGIVVVILYFMAIYSFICISRLEGVDPMSRRIDMS